MNDAWQQAKNRHSREFKNMQHAHCTQQQGSFRILWLQAFCKGSNGRCVPESFSLVTWIRWIGILFGKFIQVASASASSARFVGGALVHRQSKRRGLETEWNWAVNCMVVQLTSTCERRTNALRTHKTHLERSPMHMWRAFGSPAWNFSQALGKWTKCSPPWCLPCRTVQPEWLWISLNIPESHATSNHPMQRLARIGIQLAAVFTSTSHAPNATPLKIGPCDAFSFYKPKPPIKWKTKWKNL